MRHGSLFSGIGGFDLAAEWMGWENIFHCEWNEFGQKVLKHYWPDAELFTDITKSDFKKYHGTIDIISGGFPCQPYSAAGKRLGKEDDRHLWPEMLRAIREIQPRWVVGENVFGLVNWSGGLVFDEVQTDLEAAGYEVFPYVLPAAAVGAPHRRDRIWFVAHAKGNDNRKQRGKDNGRRENVSGRETKVWIESSRHGKSWDAADTTGESSERMQFVFRESCEQEQEQFRGNGSEVGSERNAADTDGIGRRENERKRNRKSNVINKNGTATNWQTFPTVSPICDGNDGISDRLDSITFPKWRNESIKAAGNAIVPQVVFQIFKAIEQYEQLP